jgi:hypothetical protein
LLLAGFDIFQICVINGHHLALVLLA